MKGQVEKDVKDLNFKKLFVYRPGLLIISNTKFHKFDELSKFNCLF